ncbi:MAG TPA: hypothetical protein V6C84_18455 [Coleofasciculaceae cyanobacterium]
MPILNNIDITRFDDLVINWFRECTPKILVVTDNLNYSAADSFGLTEFVDTLRATSIHSMTPIVITASFNPNPAALLSYDAATRHISNYKFTDATHGLLKSRYDVVFILSINTAFSTKLTDEAGALNAVTTFMQAGGGVFATGDHEDLGAGMCMEIPRVRNMRYWTSGTPSAGGTNRLTTNLPGTDDIYTFSDQSDQFPQRLFVNYQTQAGGSIPMMSPLNYAHPVLQISGSNRAIEVFPDHPHEGECIVPSNLSTKLADGATDEWPRDGGGSRVSPEMVAITVSHGNGFPGKQPVIPRSFIAICAYDGQRANVGRVVTDATWHHFVNINIKPGMAALAGRNLTDIKQYYSNLATWLMPKNVRFCRRYPWIIRELVRYPLFEEIPSIPRSKLDGLGLREIGAMLERALLNHHPRAEVAALIDDALEEAIGADAKQKLNELGREFGNISAYDAGLAAIGSLTLAIAERFNEVSEIKDEKINGEKIFSEIGKEATTAGVKLYLASARSKLNKMEELIDLITR